MRTRLIVALASALLGVAAIGGIALATTPTGVTSTTFAVGHFSEIDAKTLSSSWQARIDTKGAVGRVRPGEPHRAGRELRLALAPRAEPRRGQVRDPHPLSG